MQRLSLTLVLCLTAVARAADPTIDFNRDVRPILSDACFACHGFDAKARKAKLRLDIPEGAFEKRATGTTVVPGKPKESEILARVNSTDPQEVMPPPHTNKTLTPAQKKTLRLWIEQGAKYQKHWAFEPITRPNVAAKGPAAIDEFLLASIKKAGLAAQPRAEKEVLIRRVAFTLTGLPPTLKEVDEFLADSTPQAYEKMIDRYLASPRYGEEMARHWLDVARYADTHGLHLDNERQMWAYRDWVIKAFNDNLRYDQFTRWQVAGDLLPNPTQDQLVATGFNRCNVTTSEGGSIDAEFVYRYAVERTTAVAQAWLGLTAGCAVCHDHKYDPISQKEFYSLYAFFNSAADPAMDGNINTTPPFIKVPRPELKASAEAAGRIEREARALLEVLAANASYLDPAEAKAGKKVLIRDVLFDDVLPLGASSRTSSRNATDWLADPTFQAAAGRRVIRQAYAVGYNDTLEFKQYPVLIPNNGVIEISFRIDPMDLPKSMGFQINGKGITWNRDKDRLVPSLKDHSPAEGGKWYRLVLKATEIGLKPGDRINSVSLNQNGGVVYWDNLTVAGESDPATDPLESFSVWKKTLAGGYSADVPNEIRQDDKKLKAYYLAFVARPQGEAMKNARLMWETARATRVTDEEAAPGTFIFKDSATPRESFVMMRGQYDKPGDKVTPAGPAILPPIAGAKPGARLNRLDLANWLVAKENPLTARVTVNRLWQQVFGVGLVKTSYDFGSQGTPPSHPELLDFLAAEFQVDWDVKKLIKTLLLTEAFQRSPKLTAEVRAKDPENRLLARGPRLRLDAEQIRDNVLAVSGLLDTTMGGRGVKPYQPANIWEPVGYADSNTRFYLQDHGQALYRRSVYIFLKRTAPPPYLSNFDAPNREQVCTVRERSNTPLQALQLMNDPQHFEAARALAERLLAEAKTDDERIALLYRLVLARKPDEKETTVIRKALEKQLALYKADPEGAKKAIRVGESKPRGIADDATTAAWTMIANLVLNLDETVNRN